MPLRGGEGKRLKTYSERERERGCELLPGIVGSPVCVRALVVGYLVAEAGRERRRPAPLPTAASPDRQGRSCSRRRLAPAPAAGGRQLPQPAAPAGGGHAGWAQARYYRYCKRSGEVLVDGAVGLIPLQELALRAVHGRRRVASETSRKH